MRGEKPVVTGSAGYWFQACCTPLYPVHGGGGPP